MRVRKMLGNHVMVKLDPENNFVIMPSGVMLYIDNRVEAEKHTVVLGTVTALPDKLNCNEMPWETENELKIGDRVVMYYMAVMNCLASEKGKFIQENDEIYIFIKYSNIYAAIRGEEIIPVNGYLLAEAMPDPWEEKEKEYYQSKGIQIVKFKNKSNTNVVFAKIIYMGKPNKSYKDEFLSDEFVDVKIGDVVILKKIRDIPIEYEYHSKVAGGKGKYLYRIQRHDILAVL